MKRAVVSNTGTLIVNPMKYPAFKNEFIKRYGDPKSIPEERRTKYWRALQKNMGIKDELHPNVNALVKSIKDSGMDFMIFAGPPPEKTMGIYRELGVPIDRVYRADGDRSKPETFVYIRECMAKNGFEPAACLIDDVKHVIAATEALGKGLFPLEEFPTGYYGIPGKPESIYGFKWEEVGDPVEMDKLIRFIKG